MRTAIALAAFLAFTSTHLPADDEILFMELPPEALPSDVGSSAFAMVGSFFEGGAFTWMPTSGVQGIGGRSAVAVSRDGRVVVGNVLDTRGFENAAIWQGGRRWQALGSFSSDAQPCDRLLSSAYGTSDDGRVIVGLGWDGCRYAHGFRWEASAGMVDLGSTTANSSRANNVSGDGRVVIGWQEDATGFRQGAKWVNGQQELFRGPNGIVGEAFGSNRDGSLIVGAHCDPAARFVRSAWTWAAATGVRCYPVARPPTLPDLPYTVMMRATSNDGRVIGGAFTFGLESESLIWLDGQQYFLKDYLRANGHPDAFRDWVNTGFVTGVSPDGRTLVGYGAGRRAFQGFLVILPEKAS